MMTLEELRLHVQHTVNFSPGTVGQDFPGVGADANRHIDWGINSAYRKEVEMGKQNGSRKAFQFLHEMTWPASTTRIPVPEGLVDADILAIRDDTESRPGPLLRQWDSLTPGSGFYVEDKFTWAWEPAPAAAKTLRVLYLATAQDMKETGDVPYLIPSQHHDLIVWSASILLRTKADERPPAAWLAEQKELRAQYWKVLAQGHPMLQPPPRIRVDSPDVSGVF